MFLIIDDYTITNRRKNATKTKYRESWPSSELFKILLFKLFRSSSYFISTEG